MTVDAAAADHAVAAVVQLRLVVNDRRMAAADVAPLAEHRHLRDEHPVVVRAVRIVAARAVLASCRVLPEIRAALLGVAARARLVFSCAFSDFGLCTLWQLTHETLRASCMLPCHCAWLPLLWQLRHVSFASRAVSTVKRRMSSFLPESTCFCPAPWQVSHACPFFAAGVRAFCALPCSVSRIALASVS